MIGETLSYIDVCENEIRLETVSGKVFTLYHEQDCCEGVDLVNVEGNFQHLLGKVVTEVIEEIDPDDDPIFGAQEPPCESRTNTRVTFKTDEDTVITRWVGESNGYYSEGVDFIEITKKK